MEFIFDKFKVFTNFISDATITLSKPNKQLKEGVITENTELLVNGIRLDNLSYETMTRQHRMIHEIKTNLDYPLNKTGLQDYLEKISQEIIEINQKLIPDEDRLYYIFPQIEVNLDEEILTKRLELSSIYQFFKRVLRETIIEIDRMKDEISGVDIDSKSKISYSSQFRYEKDKIALIELCIAWYYDDAISYQNKDLNKTELTKKVGELFNVEMPKNPFDSLGKGGDRTISDNHLTRWGNIIEKYYKGELPKHK